MKNNYNKLVALVLLALVSFSSYALQYKNDYFVWTYYNVTNMGGLAAGVKELSRQDTPHFWNSGEPNNAGNGGEHCATQAAYGGWNDANCNASQPIACFNGSTWAKGNNINLNSYSSTNLAAVHNNCPTGYSFAAPINAEQKAALDAVIGSGVVWINSFDNAKGMGAEGVWVLNRGVTHLFGPAWAASQPSSAGQCASINSGGQWQVESCATSLPIVCATQDFAHIKVVGDTPYQSNIEIMHNICRTQGSTPSGVSKDWWLLAAPATSAQNAAVQSALGSAGVSRAWLNATGNKVDTTWQYNLNLTNWAANEPNFGNNDEKQCVVARQTDGKWQMANCDSRAYILCSDGDEWIVRKATHQFSNQAFEACSRPDTSNSATNPYRNHTLKTPITEADRQKAIAAIRGTDNNQVVWLNMKHIRDTEKWLVNESYHKLEGQGRNPGVKVWYHTMEDGSNDKTYNGNYTEYWSGGTINRAQAVSNNAGVATYFAHQEPNGTGNNDCIQVSARDQGYAKAGQWDDTSCTNSKRVACYDGFEWRVSPYATALGANNDTTEDISAGHNACAAIEKNGVTGNFRFAAPASFAESQELAAAASAENVLDVWVNVHSKKYSRTFVINQGARVQAPFWNTGEPNNAGAGEDCATQQKTAGWNDLSCGSSLPIACYNPNLGANGTWKVTNDSSVFTSVADFALKCQTAFGSQYKYYAPETLSQQKDLQNAMGAHTEVYINANDIEYEGNWQINVGINNWAENQPSTLTTEQCVSVDASTSFWRSRNCADTLPVACSSGARWYFTNGKVSLSEYVNAEKLCVSEFGRGYQFAAPRSLHDALALQQSAKLEGLGGEFWINGNRLENFNEWKWNAQRLSTPVWGINNQPDGGTVENCAVINNNSEGSWDDENCATQHFAYLCRNGNTWQVSTATGTLADFSTAVTACSALGTGWVFAAPTTYNENLAAKNVMGSHVKVWVNATDAISEGDWLLNSAPIKSYPLWGDITAGNCLYQDAQGLVTSMSCTSSEVNPWACFDGNSWKVTKSTGHISKFVDGHKACLREYGSKFIFAAPLSMHQAIQLDFARLQAAHDRSSPISKVWLNMTTATNTVNREFRSNLPFSNWQAFNAGEEPLPTLCAYKNTAPEGANNPWRAESCTGFAAHYACTDGDNWKVALSKGSYEGGQVQLVPQVGQDYWSYERGNSLCKEQYGSSYFFSAPITAAEESALDSAIRRSPANVKNVWINYYGISAISGVFLNQYDTDDIKHGDGMWFANRLKLGTWQKSNFNNYNNANCSLLHKDGSYTDASCSNNSKLDGNQTTYSFACFDGIDWTIEGDGYWEEGFKACEAASNSIYAVPRTPEELSSLTDRMGATQSIWINFNDTNQEGQWIANRLRYSFWANNEPRNDYNKDCAQINHATGEWFTARCSIEMAAFACRTTTSGATGTTRWNITTAKGFWSEGFGACAKEFEGSQFMAPEGYGAISGSQDQETLKSVIAAHGSNAWLNLSDQDAEGAWRVYHAYSNWGVDSLFNQDQDCAYIDTAIAVQPGKGNWFADSCKYTASSAVSRGYSCTNGSQWKVVETAANTDLRWSAGFTACSALGSDWYFAAPTNALQNRQLNIAMKTAGVTQLWLNAHDRIQEGEWQINGKETNFPPEADVSATATVVNENTANIVLHATLTDDEEQGIDATLTKWELISNRTFKGVDKTDINVSNIVVTPTTAGGATVTAHYSTPVLFKEDRLLTFKLTATDVGSGQGLPATSETYVNVRVTAPLLAAWDFEDTSRPQTDITGHGHDILVSSLASAMVVNEVTNGQVNRAARLAADSLLKVSGIAENPAAGLDFSANEYTIALRISVEGAPTGAWRGIAQKGDSGMERQPGLFLYEADNRLHSTNSTTVAASISADSANELQFQQWQNIIYAKKADQLTVYVDGAVVAQYNFASGETSVANTGSFYMGAIPGAAESFVGLIDDIFIFNRALSQTERETVLPATPLGEVQFKEASAITDEYIATAPHTYAIELERLRGSVQPLTVYVDHKGGSATKGTLADMVTASDAADFAFTHEAQYVSGKGIPVTWAAGERGVKRLSITLDNADDTHREGTETAQFEVTDFAGANQGANKNFTLYLTDLTPNPYGTFSVGIKEGSNLLVSNKAINETDTSTQQICFRRDIGSAPAAIGKVTVNYTISGNAVRRPSDPNDPAYNDHYDYEVIGSLQPGDDVIFNTNEHTDQCFDIKVNVNPGTSNHDVVVNMNITPEDSSVDALLNTEMATTTLLIQDYNPGVFAFTTGEYTCYEEVKAEDLDSIVSWARPAQSACIVVVKRSGTGANAPAASLQLQLSSNSYGLSTANLAWPAINSTNPAGADEQQYAVFTIEHDNIQNSDEVVSLTLQPQNGEEIDASGINAATLYIQDATSPAVVNMASVLVPIKEGASTTFTLTRTGNTKTYFDIDYQLEVVNATVVGEPQMPEPVSYYVSQPAPIGVISFAKDENSKTFTLNTIDTVKYNPDIKVKVNLFNPQRPASDLRPVGMARDDVIGLGVLANAGAGADNKTVAEVTVHNTRDQWTQAFTGIEVTRRDGQGAAPLARLSDGTATVVEHRTKANQQIATHGYVDISISMNAYEHLFDVEDTALAYEIIFDDGSGSSVINGMDMKELIYEDATAAIKKSSIGALALTPTSNSIYKMSVLMPYVTAQTGDIRMDIKLTGNNTGLSYTDSRKLRVSPVWQPITITSNECLYTNGNEIWWQYAAYGGSNCSSGQTAKFDLNLYTEQIREQGTQKCMWAKDDGSRNEVFLTTCNESANNQKWYWSGGSEIHNRGVGPKLCGAISGYVIMQNSCSYGTTGWK